MKNFSEMKVQEIGMPSMHKVRISCILMSFAGGGGERGCSPGMFTKRLLGLRETGEYMTVSCRSHVWGRGGGHLEFMKQLMPKEMGPILDVTALSLHGTWELETFVSAVGAVPHAPLSRSVLVRQEDVTAGD
jgi:hypothetical protein